MKYNRTPIELTSEQFRGAVNFFMLMGGASERHIGLADLLISECFTKGWDPLSTARQALNTVTDGEYERSLRR